MDVATSDTLSGLYLEDETAWLEAMAALVRRRDLAGLDLDHLGEYLSDMARRDRREVKRRLALLIMHLLKWEAQPDRRSRSWRSTVLVQRQELADLASRGVLRAHAEAVLAEAYDDAVELAAAETGLPASAFPAACQFTVALLLTVDLAGESMS